MNNYYDFQIDNVTYTCEISFDSVNEVLDYAKQIKATLIRQNHRDCTPWIRKVVGEYGDWMDIPTFESAVYEYNHTRI
jgi:hypothetical protein